MRLVPRTLSSRRDPGLLDPAGRLLIGAASVPMSHAANTQQESAEEIEPWLAPGTEVVLKGSDIPLRDGEWLALSRDHLTFSIEKVSGERLLVASRDKTQCGWILREYVVPLEARSTTSVERSRGFPTCRRLLDAGSGLGLSVPG